MEKLKPIESDIFSELDLEDSGELRLKSGLIQAISLIMKGRGINQTGAAKLTGISQPDLSRLLNGHIRDVSSDRLFRALRKLGAEIDISPSVAGELVGETIHLESEQIRAFA